MKTLLPLLLLAGTALLLWTSPDAMSQISDQKRVIAYGDGTPVPPPPPPPPPPGPKQQG